MKYFIQSIILCLFSSISLAQTLEESMSFGGDLSESAQHISKDSLGNIYLVGGISSSTDFNPLGEPHLVEVPTGQSYNMFVAKYKSDMTLDWVVSPESSGNDVAYEFILDDSLNVYVLGMASDSFYYNIQNSSDVLDCSTLSYVVLKFDNNGEVQNAQVLPRQLLGNLEHRLFKANDDYIYVYGGDSLTKFSASLDEEWTKPIGGYPQIVNETEIHCVRSLYRLEAENFNELVLEQYNLSTGQLLDTTVYGQTSHVFTNGYTHIANNGDLIIYGNYAGEAMIYGGGDTVEMVFDEVIPTPNITPTREFISRFSSTGDLIWSKAFENKGPRPGHIREDEQGNLYLVGRLVGQANFDPVNEVFHSSNGGSYIAKYDNNFNYLAIAQFLGGLSVVEDIQFYGDTILLCGGHSDTIDVDLGLDSVLYTPNGFEDGFMVKYSNFNIVGDPVSVEEIEGASISIFPNPSKGKFNIVLEDDLFQNILFEVVDVNGRVLFSLEPQSSMVEIDLSNYPKALYILRAKTPQSVTGIKLITVE